MKRFLLNKALLIDGNLRSYYPCDPLGADSPSLSGVSCILKAFSCGLNGKRGDLDSPLLQRAILNNDELAARLIWKNKKIREIA